MFIGRDESRDGKQRESIDESRGAQHGPLLKCVFCVQNRLVHPRYLAQNISARMGGRWWVAIDLWMGEGANLKGNQLLIQVPKGENWKSGRPPSS